MADWLERIKISFRVASSKSRLEPNRDAVVEPTNLTKFLHGDVKDELNYRNCLVAVIAVKGGATS